MKALILILAAAIGLVLAIAIVQSQRQSRLRTELTTLAAENAQKSQEIADLQTARDHEEWQHAEILRSAQEVEAHVRSQQLVHASSPTNAQAAGASEQQTDKAGFGGFLSKMMKDPDTKKFIRDQQRMMMDQLYSPLIKKLGLSSEEAVRFKDLLADHTMKGAEKATAMFGGSPADRKEMTASIAAEQKAFDEEMRAFLGEDRFAVYRDYQEGVGDRTRLNLFKQQADEPLTDAQTEQLLALMKEERGSVAAETGQNLPGGGQDEETLEAMLSPERAEKLLQAQGMADQRVLERAGTILSAEQLQSFGAFQTNQLQMMRMGISMARKLMGSEQAETTVPEAGPR